MTWWDPRSLRPSAHGGPPAPRVRSVLLADVVELRPGHGTAAWWSAAAARKALPIEELCWSLVARDNKTLDLAAETVQQARLWQEALNSLLREQQCGAVLSEAPITPPGAAVVALEQAVREGRHNEVAALLHSRRIQADTVLDANTGDTALLLACRLGHNDVVEAALSHGARNDPHPTWGGTGLQLAVAGRHVAAAAALLRVAAESCYDRDVANHVILGDSGALRKGDAPLHLAARLSDARIVQLLLEHHADPLAPDGRGRTPAHIAIADHRDGAVNVLALLLDASGETVDARENAGGETPLHVAALVGAPLCAKLLLETAADATARNVSGEVPRDVALRNDHFEIAELVVGYAHAGAPGLPAPPSLRGHERATSPGQKWPASIWVCSFSLPR